MACGRTVGKTGHRFASYLRRCGLAAVALLCISGLAAPGSADDGPIKATLAATVNDGYARLIFDMSEYDDVSVRVANNVLVITFKRPIDVSVDRLATQIPDYVGAARSRRQGHSRGAGAAGQGQCHAGRGEIFHRSVAGVMERAAAQPAVGGHCRPGAPRS